MTPTSTLSIFFLMLLNLGLTPDSVLHSQDCMHDSIPPVLICKDSVELRWGWCGNEMIYPWEFIQKVSDNCQLQSVSFDKDGLIKEMDILHFEIKYGLSNTIPIYAKDTSGNVSVCFSIFKVNDETYYSNIKMNVSVHSDFWSEDFSFFKLGIQSQDQKLFWNTFDDYSGSQLSIPIGNYIDPQQFRIDINEKKSPEKSLISTFDMIQNIRHITGINCFEGTINKINGDLNEDGSIDIRDVKAQYDHMLHWSPTDPVYTPIYKASFIEPDGKPIADTIPYDANANINYNVSLDQLGNINRSIPYSNITSQEPVSQIPGQIQYWVTNDLDCKKGQKYILRFRHSDSSYFFAIQSGLMYNRDFLKVDSVYVPYGYSSKFYSKILPHAIRTVFLNTSNPNVKSEYPEFNIVITAQKDFRLSDGFQAVNTDMSQLKINYDGEISSIAFRFHRLKSAEAEEIKIQKLHISPNPSTGVVQLNGYFPGTDKLELNIYDVYSNLILQKSIQLFSGYLNEFVKMEHEGLFYLILKEGNILVNRQLILVDKN